VLALHLPKRPGLIAGLKRCGINPTFQLGRGVSYKWEDFLVPQRQIQITNNAPLTLAAFFEGAAAELAFKRVAREMGEKGGLSPSELGRFFRYYKIEEGELRLNWEALQEIPSEFRPQAVRTFTKALNEALYFDPAKRDLPGFIALHKKIIRKWDTVATLATSLDIEILTQHATLLRDLGSSAAKTVQEMFPDVVNPLSCLLEIDVITTFHAVYNHFSNVFGSTTTEVP